MPRSEFPTAAEPRSETLTLRVINELRSVKVLLQGGAAIIILISGKSTTGHE